MKRTVQEDAKDTAEADVICKKKEMTIMNLNEIATQFDIGEAVKKGLPISNTDDIRTQ